MKRGTKAELIPTINPHKKRAITPIQKFPIKNKAYEEDKSKLIVILENITSEMKLTSEMKKVLSPYIDFEDSVDSRDHDFDDFDLQLPISFEHDQNYEITTSGNVEHNYNNTELIL